MPASGGLDGKPPQIVYTGVACSPVPGEKPIGHMYTNSNRYIGSQITIRIAKMEAISTRKSTG